MSFPLSFFDPVVQPLVLSTAQHNRTFKWLGLDNNRVIAYGFYVTAYDRIELFCLNVLTRKFRKCLSVKFTNPTADEIVFYRKNLDKFLYSAAISDDGRYIGIIQSVRHMKFINFFIFSLENGALADRFKLMPSVEIASESRYKCRLKNVAGQGWILHYERDELRKYFRINLHKPTNTATLENFLEIRVGVLKEFDSFMRYDFTRILRTDLGSKWIISNYIPNVNAYPTYNFVGLFDEHPLVSHVCFFPFKQDSDSTAAANSDSPVVLDRAELEAKYSRCDFRSVHMLDVMKTLQYTGAYFMYINANNKLHVNNKFHGSEPVWRMGHMATNVRSLESLAVNRLFSDLHNDSKRISEHRLERLGLNLLLLRKYFGPAWLRKEKCVDIPVL